MPPGEERERDFSLLDRSELDDISPDGKTLLFTEFGAGGGFNRWSVYLRKVDGSAVMLGEGQAYALSPDGGRALTIRQGARQSIAILPTGAGEPLVLDNPDLSAYAAAGWLPSGQDIVFVGSRNEPGAGLRLYVQNLAGKPRPFSPTGINAYYGQGLTSPDGKTAVVLDPDGRPTLYPLNGGAPVRLPGTEPGDLPMHWTPDGKYLFYSRHTKVMKVELSNGRVSLWKEVFPVDPAGIYMVYGFRVATNGKSYFYNPDGKAVNGFSHGYKRHGATTLFAALEITTGLVKTAHYPRRRRREFLDFMNEIVAAHPGREIHVILDNLNTHKPKEDRWLKRHPNVHFHFIPTYSSWLNQVECWFSILSRQALRGASFTSPQQLRRAIDDFVAAYNEKAAPFEWKKAVVFPSGPKQKYSDL